MLNETTDAGARSKLEWMQRYHHRTVKGAIKKGYI
jgi:hypothetical protein